MTVRTNTEDTPNQSKTIGNDSLVSKNADVPQSQSSTESPPDDKLYLVHIMFILIGIVTILPLTFFVTANEYWMYKFRDPSSQRVNATDRTVLQANFATGQSIAAAIPKILFMVVYTAIRHKINEGSNMFITLIITLSSFALFTGFIGVNTDTWQTAFFAVTMLGLAVINTSSTFFQMSSLVVIAKFPPAYLKTYLLGQGVTGTAGSLLQVISLCMGTSTQASAFIYFTFGTLIIFSTLILYFVNIRLPFYNYYIKHSKEEKKREGSYTIKEILTVAKEIWTVIFICCSLFTTLLLTHTNMTSLVVSEGYGHGNSWNDKYFVPVITFLLSDLSHLSGRLCAKNVIWGSAAPWFVTAEVLRMVLFVPLIMFCNILPRHHLPVLLPHDWQYIIILVALHFTSGFVMSSIFLSVPRLTKHEELSFLLITTISTIVAGIVSLLSAVVVNLI